MASAAKRGAAAKAEKSLDQMPKSVVQQETTAAAIQSTYATGYSTALTNTPGGSYNSGGAKPIPLIEQVSADKPDLTMLGATGTSFFGGLIQNDEYNPELHWRDW